MNYADKIRELRMYFGLTQDSFGESIGVSRHVISQIELGNNKPSLDIIARISKVFNISHFYFFEENKEVSSCIMNPAVSRQNQFESPISKQLSNSPVDEILDDINTVADALSKAGQGLLRDFANFLRNKEQEKDG